MMNEIDVNIPGPRTMIEHTDYYRVRNRIIRFLSHQANEGEKGATFLFAHKSVREKQIEEVKQVRSA